MTLRWCRAALVIVGLTFILAPTLVEARAEGGPEALYREGQRRLWRGQHEASARLFRRFLDRHPKHALRVDVVFGLGRALFRTGDYEGARARFRAVAREHADTVIRGEATLDLARVDVRQGKDTEARRRLEEFLDRYPDHVLRGRARTILDRITAGPSARSPGDTAPRPPLRGGSDTGTGGTVRLTPAGDTGSVDTGAAGPGETPGREAPNGAAEEGR